MIRLKREGLLKSIKLEHISGSLTCSNTKLQARNSWGCNDNVMTIITDTNNEVVFPVNVNDIMYFQVPGFDTKTSKILVFTNHAYPNFFVKDQELRVWYTEDLKDYTTEDNDGTHCIKVYAKF